MGVEWKGIRSSIWLVVEKSCPLVLWLTWSIKDICKVYYLEFSRIYSLFYFEKSLAQSDLELQWNQKKNEEEQTDPNGQPKWGEQDTPKDGKTPKGTKGDTSQRRNKLEK